MGRNTTKTPEVIDNKITETTTPETTETENTADSEPEKEYVPSKEDAVYKDGTVVIGGKRKETVLIPKEPGTKIQLDVYAKANENTALIQRGKKVSVPRPLAKVINEAQKRGETAEDYYYEKSY